MFMHQDATKLNRNASDERRTGVPLPDTAGFSTHTINEYWMRRMADDDSVPLLGLAPLSDSDCQKIAAAVDSDLRTSRDRLEGLFGLLRSRPAMMAVWLSRLAGDYYDANNFWRNYAAALSLPSVPAPRREEFARKFREACRITLPGWLKPLPSAWVHAGEFLFQAGLPLCHCDRFVAGLRGVAEVYGLPDPEDSEAIEDVRSAMLIRTEIWQSPLLKSALEAESGIYLIATAIRVIRGDAFSAINPGLGERLSALFRDDESAARRESVRWPYLRLGRDLRSFELVGPRQSRGLISSYGVRWAIDGTQTRVGYDEDAIFTVPQEKAVSVELLGLKTPGRIQRQFCLHPSGTESRILVFSRATGRQIRLQGDATAFLDCGDYYIINESSLEVSGCEPMLWPAPSNELQRLCTSDATLRPGRMIIVQDFDGATKFVIRPASRPFIDISGQRLSDSAGQTIHYAWQRLPVTWVPSDDVDAQWQLEITENESRICLPLGISTIGTVEGMTALQSDEQDFLGSLASGIHEFTLSVRRNGKTIQQQDCFYWSKLRTVEREFICDELPENLHLPQVLGFELKGGEIIHSAGSAAEHRLSFIIADKIVSFSWPRPGLFLYLFERVPGQKEFLRQRELGEVFAAEHSSNRWLRVALWPPQDGNLRLGNEIIQTFCQADGQVTADVSLGQLAALADSGTIMLQRGNLAETIAKFNKPLAANSVQFDLEAGQSSLLLGFASRIGGLTLLATNLLEEKTTRFGYQEIHSSTSLLLHTEDQNFPDVEASVDWADDKTSKLEVRIPKAKWPAGIWFIEVELHRDSGGEAQLLRDRKGGRIPIVVVRETTQKSGDTYRQRSFKAAYSNPAATEKPDWPSSDGNGPQVIALLGETRAILAEKYSDKVWSRIEPINILYKWAGKQAEFLIQNRPMEIAQSAVEAVSLDLNPGGYRSLLSSMSGVFGLPTALFGQLPDLDPLRGALRWTFEVTSCNLEKGQLPWLDVSGTFGLVEYRPAPNLLKHFADPGNLSGFIFAKWLGELEQVANNPLEIDTTQIEPLGIEHFSWALQAFIRRRRQTINEPWWEEVSQIWMRQDYHWQELLASGGVPVLVACASAASINRLWPELDLENDAVASAIPRFASLTALAARIAVPKGTSFREELGLLCGPGTVPHFRKSFSNLLIQAPELFGFYLMFWELILTPARL